MTNFLGGKPPDPKFFLFRFYLALASLPTRISFKKGLVRVALYFDRFFTVTALRNDDSSKISDDCHPLYLIYFSAILRLSLDLDLLQVSLAAKTGAGIKARETCNTWQPVSLAGQDSVQSASL